MKNSLKYPIAEFTSSSSLFWDFQNRLIDANIKFEIQNKTEFDEGSSFDISIFLVDKKDFERANILKNEVLTTSSNLPTYWKYVRKFIFLFILACIVIFILFLLKV